MNITEPAALLAHWQYRSQSLRRDRYDAETTRDRAKRDAGKHKAIFDTADPFSDLSALEDQVYQLKYLEAEADYTQQAIQAQISLDYFTPVQPKPLSCNLVKVFVDGLKAVEYKNGYVGGPDQLMVAHVSTEGETVTVRLITPEPTSNG